MSQGYEIILDGKRVGCAKVTSSGLYYDIDCACNSADGFIRIFAICKERRERLRICVPANGKMVLHTKIPQKRLQALLGFEAVRESQEEWVPLNDGEPVTGMDKIANARFQLKNGKPGLSMPQAAPCKNL